MDFSAWRSWRRRSIRDVRDGREPPVVLAKTQGARVRKPRDNGAPLTISAQKSDGRVTTPCRPFAIFRIDDGNRPAGAGDGGVRGERRGMAGTPCTLAGQVVGATVAASSKSAEFNCPHCGALYKLVRTEAPPSSDEREITCRKCGAPLRGREGAFVLKYFLVRDPPELKPRPRTPHRYFRR
jgi:hypothetical protein